MGCAIELHPHDLLMMTDYQLEANIPARLRENK